MISRRSLLTGAATTALVAPAEAMSPATMRLLLGPSLGPSLDLNFLTGALDPRLNFTRASGATYYDATGTLQTAANNVPRFDYGPTPGGVTNYVPNSTASGIVPGTVNGAGNSNLPTGWYMVNQGAGVTVTTSATTVNGSPGVRLTFSGTTSASPGLETLEWTGRNIIAATQAQTWTNSFYVALSSGSLPPGLMVQSRMLSLTSAAAVVDNVYGGAVTPSASPQRLTQTLTTSATGAVAYVVGDIHLNTWPANTAVNFSLDVAMPQMELATSAGTFVPTYGAPVTVGATPLGLLIEEQRTNSVRNSTCNGAVAGTPGTLPTNWSWSVGNGLTWAVAGVGTESGIPYIDISISGTPTSTVGQYLVFDSSIAATSSQTWTGSFYARLVAGTRVGNFSVWLNDNATSSASAQTVFSPSTNSLASQRQIVTMTTSSSTVTTIQPKFRYGPQDTTTSVSFTLRIGLPQLEQGAFATSPILTTGAAATRAADVATMAVGSWYNPTAWSIAVDAMFGAGIVATTGNKTLFDFRYDSSNRILARMNSTTSGITDYWLNNVSQPSNPAGYIGPTISSGAVFKHGLSATTGAWSQATNGTLFNSPSGGYLPPGLITLNIGNGGGGEFANGFLRRVRFWPRALASTELTQVTT